MSDEQRRLLALCLACRASEWHVIAREAQRPGGLDRLLVGEVSEVSKQARATRDALRRRLDRLDELVQEAADEICLAQEAGARLTTVLDDDYPANLRVIYNLPPFLFSRGTLRKDDVRSVAVVGSAGSARAPAACGARRRSRRRWSITT